MEGPTPVSALIHAATMVTAGVFLIARSSPIYEYTPNMLKIITVLGACTAFFAATVVNHAFFKALLFLGAGSVIHAVADEQDMRKMGFYSKDVILEVAYGKYTTEGHFSYVLGSIGAFLTAFYSTRLIYLTFLSKPNGYKSVICAAYDSSYQICTALGVLAIPSMFIGYYSKDMIIGLGTDFWGNSLHVLPENMNMIDAEFIEHSYKILPSNIIPT
eukprot:scaffold10795_cov2277-Chaetoceros_neogracile.AAC.7